MIYDKPLKNITKFIHSQDPNQPPKALIHMYVNLRNEAMHKINFEIKHPPKGCLN